MTTFEDIIKSARTGKFASVYMLCGEEPYYIDKASEVFEKEVLNEMEREFDMIIVYGKDYERDMSAIIMAARRFPMMAKKQVIIVKEAQNIKNWEPLGYYMQQPLESTVLVFCYKYGKPDARVKLFKDFEKNGGMMMVSNKLYDSQITSWILNYVRDWNNAHKGENVKISESVCTLLAENVGNDLQKIVTDLDKLVNGRPQGVNEITPELVERNIGISKDFNIFELENALVENDILKANRITQYFAQSKQHPIQKELITLFGWFQNLMIYHYLPDKRPQAVQAEMKLNYYQANAIVAAAKRFSAGKTFRIIGYLRETDAQSKGINNSSATDEDLWKELIYKILH